MDIKCLTVLEATSLKARCEQGWFLLSVVRENPCLFLMFQLASCILWLIDGFLSLASCCFPSDPSISVSKFPPFTRTLDILDSALCSVASDSLWPHRACRAPLSMGLPRKGYWSRLPFLSPGDFSYSGIEHVSLVSPALQADSLPTEPSGKLILD